MRVIAFTICALMTQSPGQAGPGLFDRTFTGDTMRVDYFHTGGPKSGETLALDRVVKRIVDWFGAHLKGEAPSRHAEMASWWARTKVGAVTP